MIFLSDCAIDDISAEICSRYRREISRGKSASCNDLGDSFALFRRQNNSWLDRDAIYHVLQLHYGGKTWQEWSGTKEASLDRHLFAPPAGREESARLRLAELHRQYSTTLLDYSFIQFLLAEQQRMLQEHCRHLGLKLFGDFQIGFSGSDSWFAQSFLLEDYLMGAPPSRTNPEGQPWNYPVLEPCCYGIEGDGGSQQTGQTGAAVRFVRQRIEKLVDDFDGLRLDHPHGLVCPWVYRADQKDPFAAVQNGARLFASPLVTDHPGLINYAIVRQDQLNKHKPRFDDNWVVDLDDAQVRRYAQLFDVIMATTREKWGSWETISCEILSTQPYPIKRVMELYGLGRFRVTQKADLENSSDVYRSENAQPEDWLMLGNHDTATIWQTADTWFTERTSARQAEYLARRLGIPEEKRAGWIERLSIDTAALVQAKFAELFVGPAQNIMVFFTDLLGVIETYNRPGIVSDDNWTLRVPWDYQRSYTEKVAENLALNIPKALATALRAKGGSAVSEYREILRKLEQPN